MLLHNYLLTKWKLTIHSSLNSNLAMIHGGMLMTTCMLQWETILLISSRTREGSRDSNKNIGTLQSQDQILLIGI